MSFKQLSLRALEMGYVRIVPVLCFWNEAEKKREKKPMAVWQEYQTNPPSKAQIEAWGMSPLIEKYCGVGIIGGNGLAIIDFDCTRALETSEIMEKFPWYQPENFPAWVKTGGGGIHLYTKGNIKSTSNIFGGDKERGDIVVDTRSVGGFAVGPGSPLWNYDPRLQGEDRPPRELEIMAMYTGELLSLDDLPECPEEVRSAVGVNKEPAYKKLGDVEKIKFGNGERHMTAASMAMRMVNDARKVDDLEGMDLAFKQALLSTFENTNPDDEEYVRIWNDAVAKKKQEKGVMWSRIEPIIREAVGEERANKELKKWDFKITRSQRIEERVRLSIEFNDGKKASMMMEVKDLYAQGKFRESFTIGTNHILERIKPTAFDVFLAQLNLEELKDTGTSVMDTVLDTLVSLNNKLKNSATEIERDESLKNRGFAKFENALFFKLTRLKNEPDLRTIKPSTIAQALQDLEAVTIAKNTWKIVL